MFGSTSLPRAPRRTLSWYRSPRLVSDCNGAAAVTLAFSMAAIIGLAGLGTEAAGWSFTHRTMQGAADAAASTGAAALEAGASSTVAGTEAQSIASTYNFVDGTANTTVNVNNPPGSGSHAGDSRYLEVFISQPQPPRLSGLFLSSGPNLQARAVAYANTNAADQGCVVALSTDITTGINVSGSAAMTFANCALYDNARCGTALNL